jgi:hypothetical protein
LGVPFWLGSMPARCIPFFFNRLKLHISRI